MRAPRLLLVACLVALTVAACGGDDDDSSGAPSASADATLTVIAEDIDFDQDEYEVEAGAVEIVYENAGNIAHTLVIDGVPIELIVRSNGDVDRGVVDLEPGEYELFCDVPGHVPAGMIATLSVT